jgi:hypothetical protein
MQAVKGVTTMAVGGVLFRTADPSARFRRAGAQLQAARDDKIVGDGGRKGVQLTAGTSCSFFFGFFSDGSAFGAGLPCC